MFSRILCGVAALFITATVVAQEVAVKSRPENRFSLSTGPQFELTKTGVENDPAGPQTMSAKNTLGGYVGLGYERKTRHGLVFSYDLQYRIQHHNVQLNYDTRNFDPRGSIALSNFSPVNIDYSTTLYLLNHRLMLGYEHRIGIPQKGLFLQEKIGVSIGTLLSGIHGHSFQQRIATYSDNVQPDSLYTARYLAVSSNADPYGDEIQKPQRFPLCGYSFNAYVGLVKKLDRRWLKSVSVGLEGHWSGQSSPLGIDVYTPTSPTDRTSIVDHYGSVNRSIGLHLALNFWK